MFWHEKSIIETVNELNSNLQNGLTEHEAEARIEKNGLNEIKEKKKESIFTRFIKQFNDFMIIILIISAIISAVLSKTQGEGDYFDSIIIISIVIFNALMGIFQESKAEKALEALKKMASPTTIVKRNGKIKNIPSTQLVSGDIIFLEAGNFVPADCRLITTNGLYVEESSLTGETIPVEKNAEVIINKNAQVADRINCVFASTSVVKGRAEAIVVNTGMNTETGKIAASIINEQAPETVIQKKLKEVRKDIRLCLYSNLYLYIFNWNIEKNISCRNVYDINRTSCCCNTRGITRNCYYNAFNWCNKNGKEKCNS